MITGAAGSGKTTTALLRLRFLQRFWRERRASLGLERPVRVLVLTFNRTLRGYIDALTQQQVPAGADIELSVSTFASWAQDLLGAVVLEPDPRDQKLQQLAAGGFPSWSEQFLAAEVDYVLGRFIPTDLERYLEVSRQGRGRSPRVDREARRRLLDQVIYPYGAWKHERGVRDWNDLAVELAASRLAGPYDIVVVDEAQDFSANQIRAAVNHLNTEFVCTFIRDSTQRIYPNAFAWSDVDVAIPAGQRRRLEVNYRNTRQIAAFARPLVDGIEAIDDANLPDFTGCVRDGPEPVVLRGTYQAQLDWTIEYLRSGQIGSDETIGVLHPLGWFRALRPRLTEEAIPWTSITRAAEWPQGPEQVALSTMHSAKGLEFDHVILLGYNAEVVPHGEEPGDSLLETHRRLLAMAIARARRSVVLGYKPKDASPLVDLLDPGTYQQVDLA